MPYITSKEKDSLGPSFAPMFNKKHKLGVLTYVLFKIVLLWMRSRNNARYSYATMSEVCAALRDTECEFRRRFMDPYEDKQRDLNGDVTWDN